MKLYQSSVLKLVIGVMAVSAIGCGKGMSSSGSSQSSTSAQSVSNANDAMTNATAAKAQADVASKNAKAAIGKLTDSSGNLNLSLLTGTASAQVQTSGVLAGLIAKLQPLFDDVFNEANAAKQAYASANAQLVGALGQLNQNDPAQKAMYDQVMAEITQVNSAETALLAQIHSFAGNLEYAKGAIDSFVSGATSLIPGFGWLVNIGVSVFVTGDIKAMITNLELRLLAL